MSQINNLPTTRKDFFRKSGALMISGMMASSPAILFAQEPRDETKRQESPPKEKEAPEVSPTEDLMREHGVLSRILLIYDDAIAHFNRNEGTYLEVVANCASIVRRFVEDYHEKLEEDRLFPRFEKAGNLVELVTLLRQQHQAGRMLTDRIMSLSSQPGPKDELQKARLADSMRSFIRMYRPHRAREDTVLFPALHSIVSAREFDVIGDEFEKKEDELFGENGFEKMVERVEGLEKKIGIYELSQFTPSS